MSRRGSSVTSSSSFPKYDVFVSHAGEDKASIAIPLRQKLADRGFTAFVDAKDMPPGVEATEAMQSAMDTADLAIIVLSPEFVVRKWPLKELLYFLARYEAGKEQGRSLPKIIPFFYRLSIADLYDPPNQDSVEENSDPLYQQARFLERMRNGEPEANLETIKDALKKLHGLMGVENSVDATNDHTLTMSKKRKFLLQELCDSASVALEPLHTQSIDTWTVSDLDVQDAFQKYFPSTCAWDLNVVLDFDAKNENGNASTPEALVREHLLEDPVQDSGIISIHGMGGVGKSTILNKLAADMKVKDRYSDGVHRIQLGMDATKATLFHELCNVLKNAGAETIEEEMRLRNDLGEAVKEATQWFKNKRCVFLVDDAWLHTMDMLSFSRFCDLARGTRTCSMVITTKQHEIVSLAPYERSVLIKPRVAQGSESRQMLLQHADASVDDALDSTVEESMNGILDICDGLPVSLAAAGKGIKMLRITSQEENVWSRYLSRIRISRTRLIAEDVADYGNLMATFTASISLLDEQRDELLGFETRKTFAKMYRYLCVLTKKAKVPATMLKHLWETQSEEHAKLIAERFMEVGLADHVIDQIGSRRIWYLTIHDSMHDFAVREATRHGEVKYSHDMLLKAYSLSDPKLRSKEGETIVTHWWSRLLPVDRYIHKNLRRHLLEAGRVLELLNLLLSPEWTARQFEVGDSQSIVEDFTFGIKALQNCNEVIPLSDETARALRTMSEIVGFWFSFAARNYKELSFQLYGRLKRLADNNTVIRKYLEQLEDVTSKPWLKSVNAFLAFPDGRTTKLFAAGAKVCCFLVLSGSEHIICGCQDGKIVIANMNTCEVERLWPAHDRPVENVAISRDEKLLVSCCRDTSALVWKIENGNPVARSDEHWYNITTLAIAKNGRVMSGAEDCTVHMWDVESGETIMQELGLRNVPTCMTVLPDGKHVVSGGNDGILQTWNVETASQVRELLVSQADGILDVAAMPDGVHVAVLARSHVSVWNIETGSQLGDSLPRIDFPAESMNCIVVSADGKRMALGSVDGKIRVYDVVSREEVCDPLEGHGDEVSGVSFLPEGNSVVSCSYDGTVRLWDLRRSNSGRTSHRHKGPVHCIALTPDGKSAVSGSKDNTLRFWDVESGQQVGEPLPGGSEEVCGVAVIKEGRRIVSACSDSTIRVYEWQLRQLVSEFSGNASSKFICMAVTPNGERVVTGCLDGSVQVWDLEAADGSHFVLDGEDGQVERVFVSDDGSLVISVSREDISEGKTDSRILVWDVESRTCAKKFSHSNASLLSRRQVLSLVGETTSDPEASVSIELENLEIRYGDGLDAPVLGTLESEVCCWATSPVGNTICAGLRDGQVAFMKLET